MEFLFLWPQDIFISGCCYGLNICIPQNSYVDTLTPGVVLCRGGSLRKLLRLNQVVREGPGPMGLVPMHKETSESSFSPWARSEERPREDFVRRGLSTSQEKSPQKPNPAGTLISDFPASITMRKLIAVV